MAGLHVAGRRFAREVSDMDVPGPLDVDTASSGEIISNQFQSGLVFSRRCITQMDAATRRDERKLSYYIRIPYCTNLTF